MRGHGRWTNGCFSSNGCFSCLVAGRSGRAGGRAGENELRGALVIKKQENNINPTIEMKALNDRLAGENELWGAPGVTNQENHINPTIEMKALNGCQAGENELWGAPHEKTKKTT